LATVSLFVQYVGCPELPLGVFLLLLLSYWFSWEILPRKRPALGFGGLRFFLRSGFGVRRFGWRGGPLRA